jgi:hypothetical protein
MTEDSGAAAGGTDWVRAWGDALRDVEVDVEQAENLLRQLHEEPDSLPELTFEADWTSPSLDGPVPEQFAERARRLLQRQIQVSSELGHAIVYARSQSRAINKLEQAETRPVFLDTAV